MAAVDTTTLRAALMLAWASLRPFGGQIWLGRAFVNAVMGLLRLTSQLSTESVTTDAKRSWVLVKAFLWTLWQRALMLYLRSRMEFHLEGGFDFDEQGLDIRGIASVPEIFAQRLAQHLKDQKKAQYMCSWAYQLLRNDRACATTDLRRFHWCYNGLFRGRPARCKDSRQQCDGGSPENCQRFKGAAVSDQSAHDFDCDQSCRRLFWDRTSFIEVSGAKAVCLTKTNDKQLRYCKASGKTLAISHVWSHGQGGRPDTTGFNACLHHRYKKLAIFFECDSYWMDTPCIPNEKALRAECINNINKIFTQSMVTLVCDRDIMGIEISNLSMDLQESVLATLLICDWNLRAWTLLEAMRGRHNIHLLCKGNQVMCFRETLKAVNENGRIDLGVLFLTSQHLLPQPPVDDYELFGERLATEEHRMMQLGFISLGEASILLSHRHASRDGDDVVIWSLLTDETAIKNVVELWKSQEGAKVRTGFLMSSNQRLQGYKGLGWAPCYPTLQATRSKDLNHQNLYLAYDGNDTQEGAITSEGLRAIWLTHKFLVCSPQSDVRFPRNVTISSRYLQNYGWGAFLRPVPCSGPRYVPAPYPGKARDPLVAVCGSNDGRCWEWRGVFEWATDDPLPRLYPNGTQPDGPPRDFVIEEVLLI